MALPDTIREAERLMVICNACRYCEGHCAVFQAMELRVAFPARDLRYLASLCHGCGSCFHHCQYAPPHAFDVNVPRTFARLRQESYERHAWPGALAPLVARSGVATALVTALAGAVFVGAGLALAGPRALAAQLGPGAFYRIVSHRAMVLLFGAAFAWMLLAVAAAVLRFWRDAGAPAARVAPAALRAAARDSATLRYLDGGGGGCAYPGERPEQRRRWLHHLTAYGFGLCFLATCAASVYEELGRLSPFPWWSAPVVLGTLGGIGLVVGPVGLLALKERADPEPFPRAPPDVAFLVLLLLTAVTGLLVLGLRSTAAMGPLLLLHLGVVMALFVTMPYGKFLHAGFRYAALVRWALERRRPVREAPGEGA